jgi:hypothetical protein
VYASIRAKGKPILSEDPALLVENRVRPVMLDPFCFRVARAKRPELFDRLREELENRRFGAVVLRSDPRTADGQAWLRDMNFGPGFAESVLRSYEFSAEKYGCLIFLPRSAGP